MNSPLVPIIVIGILALVLLFAVMGGDASPSTSSLSGDRLAQIVYAVALLGMMSAFALSQFRNNMGQSLKYLLVWGMLVAAIMLLYSMKGQFGIAH